MKDFGLGRREPKNFDHVARMPYKAAAPFIVEKSLVLPSWHTLHNQGKTSSCVGHGNSMMMSIANEQQCRKQGQLNPRIRYNPYWLWDRAKEVDEFPDTNPGDDEGTSAHAAAQVLLSVGHVLWTDENDPKSHSDPEESYGISAIRWATTVDDIRAAINNLCPVNVAFTWYAKFDTPQLINGEYWMVRNGDDFGKVNGGHDTCFFGASDERQAFRDKNSWGPDYPESWVPYEVVERHIREGGEFSLITDR